VYQYRLRPDGSCCFPYASETILKICGVTSEELREDGSKAFLNLLPSDYEGIVSSTNESAKYLTPWQHEYRVQYEDGSIHILYGDAVPHRESDGSILWYGFITDITERKKTEEALRQSEERNRTIVECSPLASIVHRQGIIIYVNPATLLMFGLAKDDQILGTSIYNWVHPDFQELSRARTIQAESHIDSNPIIVIRFVRIDGTTGESEVRSTPLIFNGIQAIHVTLNDITLRNESERKLRKSEQLYHTLVNSASIGILVAQGDKLKFLNQAVVELSGYSETELLSMPFLDLIYPGDHQALLLAYRSRLTDQTENDISQFRMVRKDKCIRWFSLRSVKIDWAGEPATLTFITDIEESVQAGLKVKEIALRFSMAARAGGVGMWEFNILQNILTWDDKMYELYGIKKVGSGATYESWIASIHPDDMVKAQNAIKMSVIGQAEYDLEFRVIWPDGSIHYLKALGEVERDESGIALNMYGTNYDITREKETKETLIFAMQKAEAANKAKSEFLANMSHEIRTALNSVIGFTDLLLKSPLDEIQHNFALNANISGNSLLGIINDILHYIKIEGGSFAIQTARTDIIEFAEKKLAVFRHLADHQNLNLILIIEPAVPRHVFIDQGKIRRIMVNLIGNAIKFTPAGEVEIRVAYAQKDSTHGALHFSVRDTGIGISEEQQQQLFQLFSQADNSITRKFGGIGLGLTVSNLLASQMGSEIRLSSEFGVGSVFSFAVPVNPQADENGGKNSLLPIKRILMIDADNYRQLAISQVVGQWGIEFTGTSEWRTAITILESSEPFDAVLVEYHMPDINGLEIIRMIRNRLALTVKDKHFILLCNHDEVSGILKQELSQELITNLSEPEDTKQLFECLKNLNPEPVVPDKPEVLLTAANVPICNRVGSVILVAEDEGLNMILITSLLKRFNPDSTILKAVNGMEAYEMAVSQSPDLIIMDIQMPKMSGIEATHKIRNHEKLNGGRIPIAALTAGFDKEKCIEAGMDEFLTKPINLERLKSLLGKYL